MRIGDAYNRLIAETGGSIAAGAAMNALLAGTMAISAALERNYAAAAEFGTAAATLGGIAVGTARSVDHSGQQPQA